MLALTQCTQLMADDPTWEGLARGLLVLGVLWWSWVGYSWLTSVVDPEEGLVRFAIFGAMAALLVVALCVPEAFGDLGLLFACAYFVVRIGQIILLYAAGRGDPSLRRSVAGLARRHADRDEHPDRAPRSPTALLQGGLWALALALDVGEPYCSAPRAGSSRRGTSSSATG